MVTGTVSVIQEEKIFEWKIDNFFQLELEYNQYSPTFCFSDGCWRMDIYPNDEEDYKLYEHIDMCVYPVSLPKPLTVTMTLSIKNVYGKSYLEDTLTKFVDETFIGFYWSKVILKSDLIQKKAELLPSDALTVVCTLKNSELSVDNERKFLDASAQTGEIIERKFLDASVQTGAITGIWELQKHFHEISLNGEISDVILKVENQEFKSHRCILAARSPVFSAMMKNEMKENVTGVVDIQDIDPKTFSDFLNYLYTGRTEDLTPENVSKLYAAADKYQVDVLKENCLDYMLECVSVENFCDVFAISVQHHEEKLKKTCFKYFGKHFLDIIQTCKWQTFLCENPITANELLIKHVQLNKDIYTLLSKK